MGDLIRAAIYCRYCRASKDNYVLEADKERGNAFAQRQGLEVVEVITDLGSRPVLERSGSRRLLELSGNREIDVIIAASMFTFGGFRTNATKLEDYLSLLDGLQKHGVEVRLLDSGEERDPFTTD